MSKAVQTGPKAWSALVYLAIGFVVVLVLGWWLFPVALYSERLQPVSFSHLKHTETAGLACEDCHAFRSDGSFTGIPNMTGETNGACLNCHDDPASPQGDDPREVAFLEEYVAKGVERIDWLVYSKQPPCVYFPHAVHVHKAEIECLRCHGPMEKQDAPPVYQENKISGYSIDIWGRRISGLTDNPWDSMKMSDCADCHEEKGASNACFVCHK